MYQQTHMHTCLSNADIYVTFWLQARKYTLKFYVIPQNFNIFFIVLINLQTA